MEKTMIRWLQRIWWRQQRSVDLRILWPICKEKALNLEQARQLFMLHAIADPCWVREYGEELTAEVWRLT